MLATTILGQGLRALIASVNYVLLILLSVFAVMIITVYSQFHSIVFIHYSEVEIFHAPCNHILAVLNASLCWFYFTL